ncbi:hypothetical protein KUV56_11830 [Ferrimonas balearica]|uniref:FimV/HubP family polar landmark protein n=1 Tax=Ferrimonas balearica TaxID=44012 RepID=UPI001C5686B5|nr:FimV/HubP family polar landmark protein [Ferrimonas balearica]MBW3140200.1 hypothetical protein [Ferrimonas balearica]
MKTRTHGICLATLLSAALLSSGLAAQTLRIAGPDGQVREVADTQFQEYGPTTRNDTLWRIANEVRPDQGITVYQVMLSIFQANPHAFNSSNFNSLERGKILRIPTREVMASLPASEAKARARQDDKQWQPAPAKPAAAKPAPTQPAAPVVDNAELDRLKAENRRLAAQLAEQQGDGEQVQRLRSELATSVEELAVMLEQNEQLKRRLDALNTEMALLQAALDEQQTVNQQLEQQMVEPSLPAEVEPLPQPDAVVAEPEFVEAAEPPSFWQSLASNPWLLTLAAVIPALALLLALFAWLRRRSDQEGDESVEQRDEAVFADETVQDEEHNDGTLEPPQFDEAETASVQLDPEMEEEGQSLSDLLREQESGRDEVDLDSHLMMDDDLDALLAEVDKPVDPEPTQAPPESVDTDFDTLLAEPELKPEPRPEPSQEAPGLFAEPETQPATEPESLPDLDYPASSDFEQAEPTPSEPEPAPASAQAAPAPAMDDEPFIDIDKLLEESEEEVEVAYPGVRFEMEGAPMGSEMVEDESAINAKLDLARAYIEIDDHDSARALLKEVAYDGNEEQKAEANTLLEQL